jgi:hypothetical protein
VTTRAFALCFLATCPLACLPADTRPVPGHVFVSVQRAPELAASPISFVSADGWTVDLDTALVGMGNVRFDGDLCNDYSEAGYTRLLDVNQAGLQKLGELYGLNACLLHFSVSKPADNSVLGEGVSQAQLDFMRNAQVPVTSDQGLTSAQGMALHVSGRLSKSGQVVSFDWGFSDGLRFSECKRPLGTEFESKLPLVSGETIQISISVDLRNLFQLGLDPKWTEPSSDPNAPTNENDPRAFPKLSLAQLIVDADQVTGNANGIVGVDELSAVTLPGGPPPPAAQSLADVLRLVAYPTSFRYEDTGQCSEQARSRNGGGPDF